MTICAPHKNSNMEQIIEPCVDDAFLNIDPPDYIYDLIQISLNAASGDIRSLTKKVELAKSHGAENREILRAMFRNDEALNAGVDSPHFHQVAATLQAGHAPLPSKQQTLIFPI